MNKIRVFFPSSCFSNTLQIHGMVLLIYLFVYLFMLGICPLLLPFPLKKHKPL